MKAPMRPMTSGLKKILDKAQASASSYSRSERELLLDLIEVEKTKAYQCFGETHLTPYCQRVLGLGEHVAPIFVRIVKKSIEVPELGRAVADGIVELTKAKTIASVITPENNEEWLAKAASKTKFELEKEVMKKTGRETKQVTYDFTLEELELIKRAQEVLSSKENRVATKEQAIIESVKLFINKYDPLAKADRSQDRSGKVALKVQI